MLVDEELGAAVDVEFGRQGSPRFQLSEVIGELLVEALAIDAVMNLAMAVRAYGGDPPRCDRLAQGRLGTATMTGVSPQRQAHGRTSIIVQKQPLIELIKVANRASITITKRRAARGARPWTTWTSSETRHRVVHFYTATLVDFYA